MILDSVKILNDASQVKINNYYWLDEYGQSNYADYDEKIEKDEELLKADSAEEIQLNEWISEMNKDESRDQFGGWRDGEMKR